LLCFSRQSATIPIMKILFTTLHAKYVHASLALPCLAAACAELDGVTGRIREFTINEPADQILRRIFAEEADVVLFSCYIWNVEQTLKLAADLKQVRPGTFVILGGPEVSYGAFELLDRNQAIDCIVKGEGETTCRELLRALRPDHPTTQPLNDIPGIICRDGEHITAAPERPPIADLDTIPSPFKSGLADLGKPLVYYETSRGCPFSCAFCMSSLEGAVRSFSIPRIERDLQLLMDAGVQTVKLVDRTFNYDAARANEIWEFIVRRNRTSRFHFEIAADLLTDENLVLLATIPPDTFRFEIGVQSGAEETLERVGRRSNLEKLFANVKRLRRETGVTIHLDLVAGLPHEDFDGFLDSLQGLLEVNPHHIQVEPLKVLKGSPMRKIADLEGYAYAAAPPYKILRTPWLSFEEICRIETISRLLDLIYNSGRFSAALALLAESSPLSRLFATAARFWEDRDVPPNLSQTGLFETFWAFARQLLEGCEREQFREALCFDFCLVDYPSNGTLPVFFGDERELKNRDKGDISDRIRQLGIAPGSRVRSFVRQFPRDYRCTPSLPRPTPLLFVYISAPGRGLQVRVLDL
jgi:radical SAM superfamily enzyme YgiQ (UPF0313 family)